MNNELFSVEQVAAQLGLHQRTIRQFIRSGKLAARKVGKQWRIQAAALEEFLGTHNNAPGSGGAQAEAPNSMVSGQTIQVTAIVDIRVKNEEQAMRISHSLLAVMNSKDQEYGAARCDHLFYKEENKLRFVLWGGARFTSEVLALLAHINE